MTLRVDKEVSGTTLTAWGRRVAASLNDLIGRLGQYLPLTGGTLTGDLSVPDEAYGAGWNGSLEVPTKNALYDKIETISGGGVTDGDKGDIVVSGTGSVWSFDTSVVTAFAKTFLDDADAASVRTTIGLGTMATQAASGVSITGGSITGITDLAIADGGTGASSASAARTNLGLAIGTDVQAYNSNLAGLAGLTLSQGDILYRDGSGLQRLAAGTSGQYLKTNGTGANPAWATVATPYEGGPITPATTSDLATWVNQGTSTVSDGTGALVLTPQANGQLRGREKTAPSAPYDIYMRLELDYLSTGAITTALGDVAGILLRDSSDGETLLCGVYQARVSGDEQNLYGAIIQRWTSSGTTFSANPVLKYNVKPFKWVRVNVTSTTVTLYVGQDGKNWLQVGTETIASFIDTIDRIGVGAVVASGSTEGVLWVPYFSTTAPA